MIPSAIWLASVGWTPVPPGVAKYAAICAGKSRMLTAKMIGMTPAWFTRNGRNVAPP